jgi:hypothetical protein
MNVLSEIKNFPPTVLSIILLYDMLTIRLAWNHMDLSASLGVYPIVNMASIEDLGFLRC